MDGLTEKDAYTRYKEASAGPRRKKTAEDWKRIMVQILATESHPDDFDFSRLSKEEGKAWSSTSQMLVKRLKRLVEKVQPKTHTNRQAFVDSLGQSLFLSAEEQDEASILLMSATLPGLGSEMSSQSSYRPQSQTEMSEEEDDRLAVDHRGKRSALVAGPRDVVRALESGREGYPNCSSRTSRAAYSLGN